MTVADLIKNTNIIKIKQSDHLSAAISKLSSSHDAAFVFTEENQFKGVINPYYSFIKSSYPSNTKVEHCIFHAPHIKINYPISKVAQLMIESKIHYLPVFNYNEKFIGIISARRVLESMKGSTIFKIKIKEILKNKKRPVITIKEDDFVSTAINEFKLYKISKLVVINKDMRIKGLLSYYDLISYLIAPKEKEHRGDRVGGKISLLHQRVKNFAKSFVLTLTPEETMEEALRLIIEKKIGSVVILDKEKHPIGIITTRDFLGLAAKGSQDQKLEIVSQDLSHKNRQILGGFFNYFNGLSKNIPNAEKSKKGEPTVIKEEGKNLLKVLKKIKKD